jgi:hypothetical protein
MKIGIWEQFFQTANQAYSGGMLHGDYLGNALTDLNLPDAQGHIVRTELELGLLKPLAQTFVMAVGRELAGIYPGKSVLHLVLNSTNQHLVIPQLRMGLEVRMQSGEIDPLIDKPYGQLLGALTKAGEVLAGKAGQLLTRTENRVPSFRY